MPRSFSSSLRGSYLQLRYCMVLSWVVFACIASRGNLWVTRINRFEDNIPQAFPTQL